MSLYNFFFHHSERKSLTKTNVHLLDHKQIHKEIFLSINKKSEIETEDKQPDLLVTYHPENHIPKMVFEFKFDKDAESSVNSQHLNENMRNMKLNFNCKRYLICVGNVSRTIFSRCVQVAINYDARPFYWSSAKFAENLIKLVRKPPKKINLGIVYQNEHYAGDTTEFQRSLQSFKGMTAEKAYAMSTLFNNWSDLLDTTKRLEHGLLITEVFSYINHRNGEVVYQKKLLDKFFRKIGYRR